MLETLYCKTYEFVIFNNNFTDQEKSVLNAFLFFFNPDLNYKSYTVTYDLLSNKLNNSKSNIRLIIRKLILKLSKLNDIPITITKTKNKKTNEIEFTFYCKIKEVREVEYTGAMEDKFKFSLDTETLTLLLNRGFTQYDKLINGKHIFDYPKEIILKSITVFEFYNRKEPIEKDKEKRRLQIGKYKRLFIDSIVKKYYEDYGEYNLQQDIEINSITDNEIIKLITENSEVINQYINNSKNTKQIAEILLHRKLKYKYLCGIECKEFAELNKTKIENHIIEYSKDIKKYFSKLKPEIKTNANKFTNSKADKLKQTRLRQFARAGESIKAFS